jgi:hypothetical protein
MSRGSGRHWRTVAALCALLCAPGAAQARPAAPGYTLIFAEVSVAISGHLGVHAHNDCGACGQGAFLNGSFNAGFSSEPPSDAVHVDLPRGYKKNGNPICNFKK